jgi:hypothetical protein
MTGNLLLASFMLTGLLWLLGEPVEAPTLAPTPIPTAEPTVGAGTTPPASPVATYNAPSASIAPTVAPTPTVKPTRSPEPFVVGIASWYRWHPGEAAAGPALRKALGPTWRGTVVTVCGEHCLKVVLTDWCQCYQGTERERLIDLDRRAFAGLADPKTGLTRVVVRW